MRYFIFAFIPFMLASCTVPEDIAYCERLNVDPEHPEYEKCLAYFAKQHGVYQRDLDSCNMKADETYPPTLYDRGRPVYSGGFGFGGYGRYHTGGVGWVGPDGRHNKHVDALRNRIIEPCMREKGWRDPHDWEAGRSKKPAGKTKLPWRG